MIEEENEEKELLKFPKCGSWLIRVSEVKENHLVDCKWMCINPITCRKLNEFDIYYGYTQEDMDNQVKK